MVEYFYGRYIEPAFELCMKIQRPPSFSVPLGNEKSGVFCFRKLSNEVVKRRECYGKRKEICRSDYFQR